MANEHVKPDTSAEDHITSIIVTVHRSNGKNDILELSYLAGCGIMKEKRNDGRSEVISMNAGRISTMERVAVHQSLINLVDPFMLVLSDAMGISLTSTKDDTSKEES